MTDSPYMPEPHEPAFATAPNRRRRRALWLLAGGVSLLFATISAVIVYSDAPEPDASDLAPRRIALPDEENFYVQLSRLVTSLGPDGIVPAGEPEDLPAGHPARMPAWSSSSEYEGFSDFLATGQGWTPSRLAKWDAPLAEFASACEALLRLEKSQAPLPDRAEYLYNDYGLSRCGPQLSAAAGLFWQAGDRPRAIEILAVAYRSGARIKRSGGGLNSTYLRGCQLQKYALSGWRRFALSDPTSTDAIAELWRACREPEPPDSFREAVHTEYHYMSLIISANNAEALRSGSVMGLPAPTLFEWLAKTRVLYPLVYKPNLTRAFYAEHVRTVSAYAELNAAAFRQRGGENLLALESRDLFRLMNLYGRLILNRHDITRWAVQRRSHYLTEESLFDAVLAACRTWVLRSGSALHRRWCPVA